MTTSADSEKKGTVAWAAPTYLVCVAADSGYTLYPKIERVNREACLLDKWHDEASQTAVDVETELVLLGQGRQSYDIVLIAIWEVDAGSYELYEVYQPNMK